MGLMDFAFWERPGYWGVDLAVCVGLLPKADNRWPECRKMRIFAISNDKVKSLIIILNKLHIKLI